MRTLSRIILLSALFISVIPIVSSAQEPCGNIIYGTEEGQVVPITDCANPFGISQQLADLETSFDGTAIQEGQSYQLIESRDTFTITHPVFPFINAQLFIHEGDDYVLENDIYPGSLPYRFTKTGTYTLVIYASEFPVQVQNTLFRKLQNLLLPTAFADVGPSRILTFTVIEDVPEPTGISNVLFIPGIQASRLYMRDESSEEEKVWEPGGDDDVLRLAMTEGGDSVEDIYTKDVMDEKLGVAIGGNIYKSFIRYLVDMDDATGGPLVMTFPYDWRYDVFDIVEHGTNIDGAHKKPTDVIETLASISPTAKVTIIAHSNGGLLAKAIMRKLEDEGKVDLVDKVIFIAVPHIGTPKGIMALLHGYDQSHALGLVSTDVGVRKVMKNMPGVYGLLPSEAYVRSLTEPFISFDSSSTTEMFRNAYGFTVTNMQEYTNFITGTEGRTYVDDEVREASTGNTSMLDNALQKHESELDTWETPDGVEVFNIVGTGLPTPQRIEYREFLSSICAGCPVLREIEPVIRFTQYGDETVVSKSAKNIEVGNVYFNLEEYNATESIIFDFEHADITETETVQSLVDHILHSSSTDSIRYVSNSEPTFTNDTDIVTIHSPARIYIRDTEGNVTGRTSVGGVWRSEVPGSDYFEAGGVKYLLVPSDTSYTVVIEGEGSGIYTHERKRLQGDAEELQHHFTATITPTTVATYTKTDGELSSVSVDTNGDGKVDMQMNHDGTIIPSVTTYDDLYNVLNTLLIPKAQKKFLIALAEQSEAYSLGKKRLHKIAEKTTLLILKNKINAYQKVGLITNEKKKEVVVIINNLLKKK